MKNIADQLPPEIARRIHPDRRKNEAEYWAVRDQLMAQYQGQWIGFANGQVIASGTSPVAVLQAAEATGLHPFFICVGREDEPCRVRHLPLRHRVPPAAALGRQCLSSCALNQPVRTGLRQRAVRSPQILHFEGACHA
jgi:hypothetical protein